MPQRSNPTRPGPQSDAAAEAANAILRQSRAAYGSLFDRITPWLVEVGNWIFAGLIAFILVIIASLITVGPADRAIRLATAAFALALPLELAGLCLLRLARDTERIGLGNEWQRAVQDAGFPAAELAAATDQAAREKRRTRVILLYSLIILVVSVLLTLVGLTAALWHMRWWIAMAFLVMAIISLGIVAAALVTARPPDTPAQKAQYQRYWDEMVRQARERQSPESTGGD